jgi:hypothetical protein
VDVLRDLHAANHAARDARVVTAGGVAHHEHLLLWQQQCEHPVYSAQQVQLLSSRPLEPATASPHTRWGEKR